MKSIVLTGGMSSRFAPLGSKHLLKFFGQTLLEWHLEQLRLVGVEESIIICNAETESLFATLLKHSDYRYQLVRQENPRGMADGLLQARSFVGDGPILISSPGDVLEDHAFTQMKEQIERGGQGAILGYRVGEYFPGGYLELYPGGRIRSIVEKPTPGTEPSSMVNIVLHYHASAGRLWEALERTETTVDDHYEVALAYLFEEQEYYVCPYDGKWQPLKYPWHVLALREMMLGFVEETLIDPRAEIAPSAVIHGPVIIEQGVRVLDHATIKGPCYLGQNVVVANNALVRDSVIGAHSVVGFGTEIARSYLGEDVWTHANYIGDSVVMDNVSFGAGTITGNMRLDEQCVSVQVKEERLRTPMQKIGAFIGANTRFGIQCGCMPGIKIGAGSVIAAGVQVGQDIPAGSFVKNVHTLDIRPNTAPLPQKRS